jgi:hypothetical protein
VRTWRSLADSIRLGIWKIYCSRLTSFEHLRGHVIELGLDLGEQILDLATRELFSGLVTKGKMTGIHKSRELMGAGDIFD